MIGYEALCGRKPFTEDNILSLVSSYGLALQAMGWGEPAAMTLPR